MLDEFDNKLLIERLKRRIEQANTYFLMKIGSYIKQIKNLNPSKAQQLIQILKYGGNFEEIIKKLAEYTGMNVADINDIFYNYAKKDQYFYEKFYEYRNVPFIPFDQNSALKMQTRALSNIAANEMYDFTRANVLGYTINDKFYNLRDTYNELLDTAFLNVGQGKETFDSAMKHILEDIGGSGLKTINYASGRAVRLDSVIEMHLNSRLRELHNENQKIIGEEFGADGVEISVHLNPAPDHELAQGRQFTIDKKDKDGKVIKKGEFEKLQEKGKAKTYDGIDIDLHLKLKNNETAKGFRPISEMNCYHYVFSIVLGVSEPNYTDKELKQIIDNNNKGFEFEGKHYTNYEGTQIQRRLEREVRKQKDIQILARESDNQELIASSQDKITKLTRKYKEFSKQSGLTPYMENMRVSGYRRVKQVGTSQPKPIVEVLNRVSEKQKFDFNEYKEYLSQKDIKINDDINTLDKDLVEKNLIHLDYLTDKYKVTDRQYLELKTGYGKRNFIGTAYYSHNEILLNQNYFGEKEKLLNVEKRSQNLKWHNKVKDENLDLYTITHEYGHIVENNYARKYIKAHHNIDTDVRRMSYSFKEDKIREEIDKDIRDALFNQIKKEEGLNITEIKNKYFSGYAKSKRHYEWFAETFAEMELGEENPLTRALREWLERNY